MNLTDIEYSVYSENATGQITLKSIKSLFHWFYRSIETFLHYHPVIYFNRVLDESVKNKKMWTNIMKKESFLSKTIKMLMCLNETERSISQVCDSSNFIVS